MRAVIIGTARMASTNWTLRMPNVVYSNRWRFDGRRFLKVADHYFGGATRYSSHTSRPHGKEFSIAVALLLALTACSKPTSDEGSTRPPSPPPPTDFSFLHGPSKHCSARLRAAQNVSAAERCWIEVLSARCNVGDDCLVSCLASGKAQNEGGGCWHICWEPPSRLDNWQEPSGTDRCRALGQVKGI